MRAARWLSVSACLLFASFASAQTSFQLTVTQQGNAFIIANNSSLTFSDPVGQSESVRVTATYLGLGHVTISQTPLVFGSTAFTVTLVQALPISLDTGGSFSFDIKYLPTTSTQTTAQLTILLIEEITSGSGQNAQTARISSSINLGLIGTAPSLVLSYLFASEGNVVPLESGGSLVFPATPINTTAQATFNITNRGSGPGKVNGITISGDAFKIVGRPLFPISIAAGATFQFAVQYLPTAASGDTGQLQISVDPNTTLTVKLQGSGTSTASSLSYQVLQGTNSVSVDAGGTITLPDTNIGETNSVAVQVKNTGNAAATINSLSITGVGFQLTDPPVLPQTLSLNSTVTFSIAFTPNKPGNFTGRLLVGSDTFTLAAKGLGANLTYSFVEGGATTPIANNTLVFSPVTVSSSSQMDFVVTNAGTAPARIANIGIGEANSPFTLSGLPALPVTIDPNAEIRFKVIYTPVQTGFVSGTLRVDSTAINLLGSGTAPPNVPSYTFQGPNGNVDPLSQPAVRLSLSKSYPIAIIGVLTLAVSGLADPAVQFATGGRTVPFQIPAGSTDAIFAEQGPQIRLQTGTVAATITLTPTFTTTAGLTLTSDSSNVLRFSVQSAAPTVLASRIPSASVAGFTLVVTGYSTTRTLTNLNVTLTPASGFSLPKTQFTIDLRQISTLWFQSTASQNFGGQFSVAVPFSVQGDFGSNQTALNSISSIAVTVSNDVGTSNSFTTVQ